MVFVFSRWWNRCELAESSEQAPEQRCGVVAVLLHHLPRAALRADENATLPDLRLHHWIATDSYLADRMPDAAHARRATPNA